MSYFIFRLTYIYIYIEKEKDDVMQPSFCVIYYFSRHWLMHCNVICIVL